MIHFLRIKPFLLGISGVLTLLVIAGCSPEETPKESNGPDVYITEDVLVKEYQYLADLEVYLNENIEEDVAFQSTDSLLFIPLNSCASCVTYTLNAMSINPFSGKIIIGGNPDDYEKYQEHISNLAVKNDHYYIDSTYTMYDYRIGVSGPTMLIKTADQWQIIELSSANWPIIIGILNWTAPEVDLSEAH